MKAHVNGITPLSDKQLQSINGGWWQIVVGVVIGAAVQIMGDWENFKAGLNGGPPVN